MSHFTCLNSLLVTAIKLKVSYNSRHVSSHTFQEAVKSASQVSASVMVLLFVGNSDEDVCRDGFQWRKFHAKFHENQSTG
jgi:hypothetical protein